MAKLVNGLVQTRDEAEAAAERIIDCGYTRQDISMLMTDATRHRCFAIPDGSTPTHTFGAAIAMSVVVPGLGFVVAGPLAAAVATAVGSGMTGGLREILLSQGVPKHWAERYESGVRRGGILVSVFARNDRDAELLNLALDDLERSSIRPVSSVRQVQTMYI
ncbi:hypothetical protein SOCE26_056490 [Sorangium cellulosum]|uniref:DUF1269 domain-containing protein n=1 Tax=Sorangium cellulosum TaxID=56 RepID=A0A2L0EY47_SORCE|nr:hypothetical protein [Sorangium cellulosum]AUX44185.1 hypothetical protein SOCE26_056490 [Sorangium cellulosum]